MLRIVVPYHLDEHLPDFDPPVTADVTVTSEPSGDGTWRRLAGLYPRVADVVAGADHPVVASGDCTTALGTVAGLQRVHGDVSVVWFDAHGDVHTPRSTGSGYLGGMPLRMLAGTGDVTVAAATGLRPIPEERIALVGARDLDPPEEAYLAGARIRRHDVTDLAAGTGSLPPGPIYLHLDADVADAGDVPGLKYPVASGPGLASVLAAARTVLATGRVAGIGLACTWSPGHGAGERLRPAVAELLAEYGG